MHFCWYFSLSLFLFLCVSFCSCFRFLLFLCCVNILKNSNCTFCIYLFLNCYSIILCYLLLLLFVSLSFAPPLLRLPFRFFIYFFFLAQCLTKYSLANEKIRFLYQKGKWNHWEFCFSLSLFSFIIASPPSSAVFLCIILCSIHLFECNTIIPNYKKVCPFSGTRSQFSISLLLSLSLRPSHCVAILLSTLLAFFSCKCVLQVGGRGLKGEGDA